ncbi:MAG: hypothetical protein PHC89_02000 [Candidatus Pacebacteria bacterium]|nr:hypothetical protein [Candidatus Paceibacterota bacterium]
MKINKFIIFSLVLMCGLTFGQSVFADDVLDKKDLTDLFNVKSFLLDTTYGEVAGNDVYVSLGWEANTSETSRTRIFVSNDANSWRDAADYPTFITASALLRSVVYQDGIFVAVGTKHIAGKGKPLILKSTDGENWEEVDEDLAEDYVGDAPLFSVSYGQGKFLAVGYQKEAGDPKKPFILKSSNGENWSEVDSYPAGSIGKGIELSSVTYGDDGFVAVGSYYNTIVNKYFVSLMRSSNGESWFMVNDTPSGIVNGNLSSVAYGNGRYFAVGKQSDSSESKQIPLSLVSFDGIYWSEVESYPFELGYFNSITFADGFFAMTAYHDVPTLAPILFRDNLKGLVPLAFAFDADPGQPGYSVIKTRDANSWSEQRYPQEETLLSINFANGLVFATGGQEDKSPLLRAGILSFLENGSSGGSTGNSNSKILGTRFCSEEVTTFCRERPSATSLIPLYSEILNLIGQILVLL